MRHNLRIAVMAFIYWPRKHIFSKLWKNPVDRSLFAALVTAFHKAKAIASIMTQAERVLSRFGSDLNTIAAILGMPYKRIWNWRNSGFIPQNWHARLLAEARLRGIMLKPIDFVAHLDKPAGAPDLIHHAGQE